jgi:hypothetical protein
MGSQNSNFDYIKKNNYYGTHTSKEWQTDGPKKCWTGNSNRK